MDHHDRQIFHEEMQAAQAAVFSARAYAREGRAEDASRCLHIARVHRRIAKQYLTPAAPLGV